MARSQLDTAAAEPVRPYLEGVAKSLIDRLYGDQGPAWGTQFTELEDLVLAVRQVLSETMRDEVLQRQANTADQRPAAFQCGSQCGQPVVPKDPEPRIMDNDPVRG